jgi:uncharacterized protein DUF4440
VAHHAVLLAVLSSALAAPSGPQIPAELREAMRTRLEAVCEVDAATWDRLTADEFTVVVPEGKLLTKSERLAALKTEKPRPVPTPQHERIQRYGDTVIRRFLDGSEWILEIWVQQGGTWRVVAADVSLAK